jgi:hypothetical protein
MIGQRIVRIGSVLLFLLAYALNAVAIEPNGTVENSISLPAIDGKVTAAYDALLSAYNSQQQSVLQGQERWLKFRSEACIAEGHPAKDADACFQRVDKERFRELGELTDIRRRELAAHSAGVDLEALLDKPIDLSAYSPADMSDIYFDADGSPGARRLPVTCRELYTLTAGAWAYMTDGIGSNSEANAFGVCQNMLFLAQAQQPKRNSQIDFSDVKLYANDVMCFALRCGDGVSISDTPSESFEALKQQGKLTIESADLPMWGPDACTDTLVIHAPFFCLDGMNVRFEASAGADYTGSGDNEAVVTITFFPTEGTERLHGMFLASYDTGSQSIRLKAIDRKARIKLTTATY